MSTTSGSTEIAGDFEVDDIDPDAKDLKANFNVAPTHSIATIDERPDGRRLGLMKWGLVPRWAKDVKIGSKLINARAETVESKPAFSAAFAKRRCLIPVDGFYEWERLSGHKGKQPWRFVDAEHKMLAFAGLWEQWLDPNASPTEDNANQWLRTCAVLTTEANSDMPIHNRMPVILAKEQWDQWLDPSVDRSFARALLGAGAPGRLASYKVSERVNRVSNNDPGLIEPIAD